MRKLLSIVLLMVSLGATAQDSVAVEEPKKELSWLRRTIRGFSYIDENYVEPQHYNWSVMLQATYNYDYYRLSSTGSNKQSVSFAPSPSFKLGPYFGWRWIFAGYTFDLKHVAVSDAKQEFDFSFYAAQIGADLYYRRTGSDYKIRNVSLGKDMEKEHFEDLPFDGLSVGITGFNVYYIFNHHRFSYPAAFAQSTMQKISCGSWMAGFGYMRNSLDFDYEKMQSTLQKATNKEVKLDSGLMFNSVKYYNINASVGYAYNWVFARNCLFCSSLSLALAYKKSRGETANEEKTGFDINNFNIDGIGRFAVVYNNNRWYAGAAAIVRAYNYRKSRFAANNIFGKFNIYVGYNFGAREAYKKKKK